MALDIGDENFRYKVVPAMEKFWKFNELAFNWVLGAEILVGFFLNVLMPRYKKRDVLFCYGFSVFVMIVLVGLKKWLLGSEDMIKIASAAHAAWDVFVRDLRWSYGSTLFTAGVLAYTKEFWKPVVGAALCMCAAAFLCGFAWYVPYFTSASKELVNAWVDSTLRVTALRWPMPVAALLSAWERDHKKDKNKPKERQAYHDDDDEDDDEDDSSDSDYYDDDWNGRRRRSRRSRRQSNKRNEQKRQKEANAQKQEDEEKKEQAIRKNYMRSRRGAALAMMQPFLWLVVYVFVMDVVHPLMKHCIDAKPVHKQIGKMLACMLYFLVIVISALVQSNAPKGYRSALIACLYVSCLVAGIKYQQCKYVQDSMIRTTNQKAQRMSSSQPKTANTGKQWARKSQIIQTVADGVCLNNRTWVPINTEECSSTKNSAVPPETPVTKQIQQVGPLRTMLWISRLVGEPQK
jgi:hypothetical protein